MANEQISEIATVPTNATVIKIINALIKRYNSLGSIYTFKGSVQTYDDLLAIQNPQIGDVYNVIQEDEEHQIAAGSNFVWDGTVWDNLGGSLAGLVQSVNGINPDSLGNVTIDIPKPVIASEAEAKAGTNNTKFMSPLRVKQAIDSDLANLSNSVVKSLDNVTPVNNNINMWNWFHRYPYTDFTNGMTTIEWIKKGLFSCFFLGESQAFPQKPKAWGQLINIPASSPNSNASDAFQLFVEQPSGDIYCRGTNQSAQLDEVPFKRLAYVGGGWTISKGTNGWARENSTGLTVQWGYIHRSNSGTFTFPRTFTTCYYSNVMCSSNLVPYITARSNTHITFNTNNGYNDDIKNWGDCYIFAIGDS